MNRRSFVTRVVTTLAALGATVAIPAQRIAQGGLNTLQYVVSPGQRLFTLMRLDGTQVRADQIARVLYATAREPDHFQPLDSALYSFDGWSLKLESAWDGFSRIMVIHS